MLIKILWSICLGIILVISVYFSISLKFPQLRFKKIFKCLKISDRTSIKLLMVTLGGKIGVGSIVGVAFSIYYGGKGSIFWMIISSFACAIISFCETIIGNIYKEKINGIYMGGPSFYITKGLNNNKLGIVYSILILICYVIFFVAIQSNTISKMLPFNEMLIGVVLSIIILFIVINCLNKIINIISLIVFIMLIIYLFLGIYLIIINFDMIYSILYSIVVSAFNFKSFFTGMIPIMIIGIQRGIFANEAGLGTGCMVSSSSTATDYIKEGYIQVFGIYLTTIVVCFVTAIIIFTTDYNVLKSINGLELIKYAFNYHFGFVGILILYFLLFLFSISTIITIYYYGEVCLAFLKIKSRLLLKILIIISVFLGSILSTTFLWNYVDMLISFLIIINLYSIYKLRYKILKYVNKLK